MKLSFEIKAVLLAIFSAGFSLGSAALAAGVIKTISSSAPAAMNSASDLPDVTATPELINQGHEFFGQSCSHCHADDATGDEGPNLHNLTISNARITKTIKSGVKGEMPSFSKKYNDAQVAALVSYLRTLK